jgi:hypothetical protein
LTPSWGAWSKTLIWHRLEFDSFVTIQAYEDT